jgi:hypothetical protein
VRRNFVEPKTAPASCSEAADDAGHEVDANRPEACVSVVGDFIQRQEAFLINGQSGLINP